MLNFSTLFTMAGQVKIYRKVLVGWDRCLEQAESSARSAVEDHLLREGVGKAKVSVKRVKDDLVVTATWK